MPTIVELEQLLDIALTTPEVGTVNFNILRVFLHEILRHLNIENKAIDVDILAGELKSAYEFIKDGCIEVSKGSPSPVPTERLQTEPTDSPDLLQITVETEQEEQLIEEQSAESEEERPRTKTPALVVECKSEALVVEKDFSPSPPKSGGLGVKADLPTPSRSSAVLFGRSESLRNLKKRVSELQERVEFLESQPAVPTPDPVRSAASLVRKESKTPAHDFVELINIKRKLEASENSLDGLTEMVDALMSDVNELKETLPNINNVSSDMRSDIQELRSSLDVMKEKVSFDVMKGEKKQDEDNMDMSNKLGKLEDNERRIDGLESMLASLQEATAELTNKTVTAKGSSSGKDLPLEVSEALQTLDTHEKQLQGLETQIQEIEGKLEGTEEKSSGAEYAASDALARLEACGEGVNGIRDNLAALGKELKDQKSLIEDNEMQIHQLKNTMTLLQRESLERANEEAEKDKGRESITVKFILRREITRSSRYLGNAHIINGGKTTGGVGRATCYGGKTALHTIGMGIPPNMQ